MMKNVLKVMSVLAVTLVAAMFMVACGSSNGGTNNPDNPNNTTTNICNIDNLNGYYVNFDTKEVYWFDIANNYYKHATFSIGDEPKENGLYRLSIANEVNHMMFTGYANKLRVPNNGYATVNKVWNENDATNLISSYYHPEENKDLSIQFYAEDEKIIYTKISGLGDFLATVFPGKEIDKTDTTYAYEWENDLASL